MLETRPAALKITHAVIAAAVLASLFTGAFRIAGEVAASGSGKTDRADIRSFAQDCSQQAWPYYEAICLHDTRNKLGRVRGVRFVSTDRMPQTSTASAGKGDL